MVSKIFIFTTIFRGRFPILTNIFQRGWFNHQLLIAGFSIVFSRQTSGLGATWAAVWWIFFWWNERGNLGRFENPPSIYPWAPKTYILNHFKRILFCKYIVNTLNYLDLRWPKPYFSLFWGLMVPCTWICPQPDAHFVSPWLSSNDLKSPAFNDFKMWVFYEPIRITNNQFGSNPINPGVFKSPVPQHTSTCWVVVGSWSFRWPIMSWQAQMIQPVHSRKRYANPKFGTTTSTFMSGLIQSDSLRCNGCNSMKQAIQSVKDSRMKECSLLVIIWMSGQAAMDQKKWHTISTLA